MVQVHTYIQLIIYVHFDGSLFSAHIVIDIPLHRPCMEMTACALALSLIMPCMWAHTHMHTQSENLWTEKGNFLLISRRLRVCAWLSNCQPIYCKGDHGCRSSVRCRVEGVCDQDCYYYFKHMHIYNGHKTMTIVTA